MSYLLLTQAPCYRVSSTHFATESAFAEHLRLLKKKLSPRFRALTVCSPSHTDAYYEKNRAHLGVIDEEEEGIRYEPLHATDTPFPRFWRHEALRSWTTIWDLVGQCQLVHSGLSTDIWRPTSLFGTLSGILQRRKTLFVVDIDFRNSARMYYETGLWSLKSYLLCRFVYDALRSAQVDLATRRCDLVLLKSQSMVDDFGKGRPHVRNVFDTAHSEEHIVDAPRLEAKLSALRDQARPLELVYFGRLVAYKGLDRTIRAVTRAARSSKRDYRLHVIGAGDQAESLRELVRSLDASDVVRFHEPVPYGRELFDILGRCDLTVATPLAEDTPRAAFDSFASGLPILAFDTTYYRDLASASSAVRVTPWPDEELLAEAIRDLDRHREILATMARKGVRFARENTQDVWLDRRVAWTLEVLDGTVVA